jgi:hypothetical protein
MFFSTTEHYQDNFVIIPNEMECCFICLENENNYCNVIMLNSQQIYICYCRCNGWIHHTCLQQWLNTNQTCPICRRHVIKNTYSLVTYFSKKMINCSLTCLGYFLILMYYYIIGKIYVYVWDCFFTILFITAT